MRIVKNSFGIGLTLSPKFSTLDMIDKIVGSSLDRKPPLKKKNDKQIELPEKEEILIEKIPKLRVVLSYQIKNQKENFFICATV